MIRFCGICAICDQGSYERTIPCRGVLPGGPWTLAGATLLLVLLGAKAHGRQIRIEREQQGHWKVDFRASDNPSFVLDLWRKDRIVFWTVFASGCIAAAGASLADDGVAGLGRAGSALVWLGWAFAASFCFAGLLSLNRLLHRDRGEPKWLRKVRWESVGWWTLVAVAIGVAMLAASDVTVGA